MSPADKAARARRLAEEVVERLRLGSDGVSETFERFLHAWDAALVDQEDRPRPIMLAELTDQAFAAGMARRTLQLIAGKNMIGTVEAILIGMSIEAIDRAWKRAPSQASPGLLAELDWLAEEFQLDARFAHSQWGVGEEERKANEAKIARAKAAIEAVKALLS